MLIFDIKCTKLAPGTFLKSIDILVNKPHVVNKRLWGNKIWFRYTCRPRSDNWQIPESCIKIENVITPENIETHALQILKQFKLEKCETNLQRDDVLEVIIMELLPKTYSDSSAFELICIQRNKPIATFYNITPAKLAQNVCPEFPYTLELQQDKVVLSAYCDAESKTYLWLRNTLLPQFIKWSEETECNKVKQGFCTESLALVSNDDYYKKYNELKLKYGKDMVKIWPECTDPSKFVYEDVAIATYLLLLWEAQHGKPKKQSFVDLGCGNGLLVYILTKEGHNGVGIDVRKRNIWDMYSNDIRLEEKTVTPSDYCLFPETDWIIGNHSDELTPWIPVIAAKSTYKSNFFLLPCCAYNFDGTKYQRKNSFKSQYMDYLEYIKQLCIEIGFNTEIDRLKIPSTKRICLVSKGRTYSEKDYNYHLKFIQEVIQRHSISKNENDTLWINDFKPRDPVEKVKNCTRVDKILIASIVECICNYLLEGCSFEEDKWSVGKTVEINELVPIIPQDHLKSLKSECGGLQTLMKNHHHIFQVQSGKVQFRYPKTLDEVAIDSKNRSRKKTKIYKVRQKECWFYKKHPQGCPLADVSCSFLHEKR